MNIKKTLQGSLIIIFFLNTGCTAQAWYEGGKRTAERNCQRLTTTEKDRCLENINTKSYEEYEKDLYGQE